MASATGVGRRSPPRSKPRCWPGWSPCSPPAPCPLTTSAPSWLRVAWRWRPNTARRPGRPTTPPCQALRTKAFFARRSQRATFMAQLGRTFPGLGGHPSMSLRSSADGRPLLADGDGNFEVGPARAIAGIVSPPPGPARSWPPPNPNSLPALRPGKLGTEQRPPGRQLQLRAAGGAAGGGHPPGVPVPRSPTRPRTRPGHDAGRRHLGDRR